MKIIINEDEVKQAIADYILKDSGRHAPAKPEEINLFVWGTTKVGASWERKESTKKCDLRNEPLELPADKTYRFYG